MLKKINFFKNYFNKSISYKRNLKKTKKIFKLFLLDLENNKIPLLNSFEKGYVFDFSNAMIKKFSKYKQIFVIGMGGSILGTKSIFSFFENKLKKKIFFFDNLDENLYLKHGKIKNSCFIVVSKSGDTLETIANLKKLLSENTYRNKIVIITEIKDSPLMKIGKKYKADIIEHKSFISGRYSVLSESSMFPAALMGLNLNKFKNLKFLIKDKNFVSSLIHNVACIYTLNKIRINNSVIFTYNSSLNDLGYWYQQLIAESLGKKGKGINPILSFGPKDHHSLLQLYLEGPRDKFFTFFNLSEKKNKFKINHNIISSKFNFLKNKNLEFVIKAQSQAVKNIFKLKKIPFRQISFHKKNEKELGMIFTFFVLETILLSRLMNVNPFNQPAVEQVKIEAKRILS